MIDKKKIKKIVNDSLAGTEHFLVEVKVKQGNEISVVLDSDIGITVKHCIAVSREIEGQYDRDIEDYKLDVSSYGITNPLVLARQYQKNVGRNVKVKLKTGDVIKGKLIEADDQEILIEKKINKKKKNTEKEPNISLVYSDIDECKIEISF